MIHQAIRNSLALFRQVKIVPILLIICLVTVAQAAPLFGDGCGVFTGFQFEVDEDGRPLPRPDILTISANSHSLGPDWALFKQAQMNFVAELLEFYPNADFYFLSAEVEPLFDTARLATQGTTSAKRVHYLGLSHAISAHPKIKNYLKQEGISEESLRKGKQVVLVDTMFPHLSSSVLSHFSPKARANLRVHLIASRALGYPSSRAYLANIFVGSNAFNIGGRMVSAVEGLLNTIPRFTLQAQDLEFDGSVWRPVAMSKYHEAVKFNGDQEEIAFHRISSVHARKHMEDLRAEWTKSKTRNEFNSVRLLARQIRNLMNLPNRQAATAELKELMAQKRDGELAQAMIRDLIELKNLIGPRHQWSLRELGLERFLPDEHSFDRDASIIRFVNRNPQLAHYVLFPDQHFLRLMAHNNWERLEDVFLARPSYLMRTKIIDFAMMNYREKGARQLIHALSVQGYSENLTYLAIAYIRNPSDDIDGSVFKLLVNSKNKMVLNVLMDQRQLSLMEHRGLESHLLRLLGSGVKPLVAVALAQITDKESKFKSDLVFAKAVEKVEGPQLLKLAVLPRMDVQNEIVMNALELLAAKIRVVLMSNHDERVLKIMRAALEMSAGLGKEFKVLRDAALIADQGQRIAALKEKTDLFVEIPSPARKVVLRLAKSSHSNERSEAQRCEIVFPPKDE